MFGVGRDLGRAEQGLGRAWMITGSSRQAPLILLRERAGEIVIKRGMRGLTISIGYVDNGWRMEFMDFRDRVDDTLS